MTTKIDSSPNIRHLTSFKSAISILESGFIKSRQILDLESLNKEWEETRKFNEKQKFGTNNLIFCTPDWFLNYKHETGHGPVMIYFKDEVFKDFKLTFTSSDSTIYSKIKVYNSDEIPDIYSAIKNENNSIFSELADEVLKKYNIKNKAQFFNTSKGEQFIKSLFYQQYSEFQIHTKQIPIEYIKDIKITENYFYKKNNELIYKNKFIKLFTDYIKD